MKHQLLFVVLFFSFFPVSFTRAQELDSTMWTTDGGVIASVRRGNIIYLGGSFGYVGPRNYQNGAVVNQADGKLTAQPFLDINSYVRVSAPDGKGGWYIGGDFTKVQG